MAAKRITQSAINWMALSDRVPPHQRAQFQAFKSRSDKYLRSVLQYPEKAPEIKWANYKSVVPVPGMVDEFQKQYAALQIPYPPDTVSTQIDSQERELKVEIEKFKEESNQRIAELKKQLAHLTSLIPFDQMTMEDFRDAYPNDALDPINRPTFWPHNPEEQVDHVSKAAPSSGH
ncbi:unnamed protein product [Tenebrio molitor]|jgi:F-type H+-transporting ATPase subunit d|nr:unnamed protein product [Tenebrio molitor]